MSARTVKITGIIECVTGLRIGGTEAPLAIGIVDNTIVRDPVRSEPYIPGSSIKGKMRSALEIAYDRTRSGQPCGCGRKDCPVCPLFGPHRNTRHNLGPTRLLFRDAFFTPEQREKNEQMLTETGGEPVEVKHENIINRMTNRAEHPRPTERIAPGTEFELEIVMLVLPGDDERRFLRLVREGLQWIEDTYLGGSGSRGYGQVRFKNLKVNGKDWVET